MISRLGNGLPSKLSHGSRTGYDMTKTGAMIGRGENERKLIPAAGWSQTWPAPGATLDLDFVNDRGFVRGVGQGRSMDAVTFTRASTGTFIGPDGLLKFSPGYGNNSLTFPQEFDNAVWGKSRAVVLPNATTAPDGTLTADAVNGDNINTTFPILTAGPSFTGGIPYTLSAYFKKKDVRYAVLGASIATNTYNFFDLDTGTTSSIQAGYSGSIQSVGDGWYRASVTFIPSASQAYTIFVGASQLESSSAWTISSDGIFAWGAQLETGSIATEYFPTNFNLPRFDWGSVTTSSIRNYIRNSEIRNILPTFQTPTIPEWMAWTGSVLSFSTDGTKAPDGITDVTKIVLRSGSGAGTQAELGLATNSHNGVWPAGLARISLYAKAAGYSALRIRNGNFSTSAGFTFCELTGSGQIRFGASSFAVGSGSIQDVGSGWYFVSFVTDNPSSVITLAPCSDYVNGTCVGNGTDGAYVYGAQLEIETGTTSSLTITGNFLPTTTALAATGSVNGYLSENSRTNLVLWNRDVTKTYTPPSNLFAFSEIFTSSVGVWNFDANQAQIQRITGSADPFGGTRGTRIVPNAGRTAANAYIGQRAGTSTPSTFSVYMSASGHNFGVLGLLATTAGNFAVFDLASGSMAVTASTAGLTSSIENVGGGWYRCALTVNNVTLNRGLYISSSPSSSTATTGSGTAGIIIWGAQANNGTTPTTYVSTSALPTPLWVTESVTLARDQVGIDGVANAASSISASANTGSVLYRTTNASQGHVSSIYLKRISGSGSVQTTLDGITWSAIDLSTTEWRRAVLTGTVTNPCVGVRLATAGDIVAMDYSQVEVGAEVTTPILTTTATVTRAVDSARIIPTAFPQGVVSPLNHTLYSETLMPRASTVGFPFGLGVNARLYAGFNGSALSSELFDGVGGAVTLTPGITYALGEVVRSAVSAGRNEYSAAISGRVQSTIVHDENVGAIPVNFSIGFRPDTALSQLNGCVQRVSYFPFRLQMSQLLALTQK